MTAASAGPVAAQGTGDRVVGMVVNGTPGGELPVGAPVTLQFLSEGAWSDAYTSTLAADGSFLFEDLGAETGSDFLASLVYQDVAYFSEPTTLEGGEVAADISIFESSEDATGVRVDQAHLFVFPREGYLQIAEYYLVGSGAERAFVGTLREGQDRRTTLSFTVPAGASSLEFEDLELGERFLGDGSAFADTMPVLPGSATTDVGFSYELAYIEGMEITRTMAVPVKSVAIIVNGSEVGIEGTGVTFAGMIDTQRGQAASYTAGPLEPGTPLALRFVPQTNVATTTQGEAAGVSTGRVPRGRDPMVEGVVGAVVLAAAAFGAYLLWRRQTIPPVPEAARDTIVALAALDQRYAAGAMGDTDYAREREALLRKVRATLQRRS